MEEPDAEDFDAWDDDDYDDRIDDMPSDLRPQPRASDGKSYTPLLGKDKPRGYSSPQRPPAVRRTTSRMHERDPPEVVSSKATRKRYTYAACFLLLSLVSFTVQTETAVYIQHTLKWNKAYCML